MSKALVEMQIENNKIKEEAEVAKFELTNKVRTRVLWTMAGAYTIVRGSRDSCLFVDPTAGERADAG